MATIRSGVDSTQWTIDPVSKAGRFTPYDVRGNERGVKHTYRAASIVPFVPAVTANRTIFTIGGSGSTVVTVRRIIVTGGSLTAVAYIAINAVKYSTACTGGTSTNLPQIPLDSTSPAGTAAQVRTYTAVPTDGTLVGTVASRRKLFQATTPAAAGVLDWDMVFDFGALPETHGVVLRTAAQELALLFPVAPATTPTLSVEVEWTEE